MVKLLKGLSKEKREEKIVSELEGLGQKKFNIDISEQAKKVIANCGEDFPLEHFMAWFLKNKMIVHGGHVQEYLAQPDGFDEGINNGS